MKETYLWAFYVVRIVLSPPQNTCITTKHYFPCRFSLSVPFCCCYVSIFFLLSWQINNVLYLSIMNNHVFIGSSYKYPVFNIDFIIKIITLQGAGKTGTMKPINSYRLWCLSHKGCRSSSCSTSGRLCNRCTGCLNWRTVKELPVLQHQLMMI